MFPVQPQQIQIDEELHRAAYEVYEHFNGGQPSLLNPATCRGGFGTIELVAYLWARSFPKEQWRERVNDVFSGKAIRAQPDNRQWPTFRLGRLVIG